MRAIRPGLSLQRDAVRQLLAAQERKHRAPPVLVGSTRLLPVDPRATKSLDPRPAQQGQMAEE